MFLKLLFWGTRRNSPQKPCPKSSRRPSFLLRTALTIKITLLEVKVSPFLVFELVAMCSTSSHIYERLIESSGLFYAAVIARLPFESAHRRRKDGEN